MDQIEIILNGESKKIAPTWNVQTLLRECAHTTGRVAIAVNDRIIPRSQHAATPLRPHDRVEIVQAVGGG